jgi:ribonucleoside-diphosphate reductase alpha chain
VIVAKTRDALSVEQDAARKGLQVRRFFTSKGTSSYDELTWERRDAVITNWRDGTVAFEQRGLDFPSTWSQNATNIVAQKYFRGPLGTPQREHSVRQMIDRVAGTITGWGAKDGYFATDGDAEVFRAELTHLLVHQKAAFNSPVWFNVGVEPDPQASACFILSVEDTMPSILNWYVEEGMIFKGGSGSGVNLSTIRSSREPLGNGGEASGPVSFMRGADASAGTIKSGGKCFREGTLVATPSGMQPIERLRIGDEVLTHRGPRAIADFMRNGRRQCYRVLTREGYEVEVTAGHKFAYWDDIDGRFAVKPIEEFRPGDALYALLEPCSGGTTIPLLPPEIADPANATTTVEMSLPTELDERLAYVVGLMYGDGELRTEYPYRVRVSFAKDAAGRVAAQRFHNYSKDLFGEEPLLLGDTDGCQQIGFTRKRLVEFLAANGIAKGKADALGFPSMLFRAEPGVRAAFIAGVIDADGSYQRRGGWSISSIDRAFLADLQRLLLTLGVPAKIKLNREQNGAWRRLYRLHIIGHTFVQRLVEHIAPHSAKAQVVYEPSPGADKGWGYRPSLLRPLAARVRQRGGYRLIERSVGMNETSGYGAVATLARHPEAAVAGYAQELATCVQLTLEVVTPTEVAETYDIEVEGVHLLSANGIYSSNTRRAAKMVILNVDHPDVRDFIWCKAREEHKARVLRDAGFDMDLDGRDSISIQYQNANNSVRVTDDFMHAYEQDRPFALKAVLDGRTIETVQARELMREVAQAAWECADPGMQYDTTINDWHTTPESGRINASNPCSEYMHLDNSACNLASLNLLKFLGNDGKFDVAAFKHAVEIVFLAQEIIVGNSSYPTERITGNAKDYRQLGLGYANLGALLMALGKAYDSDGGRAWAGAITALMTGHAYRTSARIAQVTGPFAGYPKNREPMLRVMRKHRAAVDQIESPLVQTDLFEAARTAWDEAIEFGKEFGYRNAQASVLAPTGTIGLLMDCDTTGIEPDLALVKTKKLVGGGSMSIVNQTVPRALRTLGYADEHVQAVTEYVAEHNSVKGAPALREEHYEVFDCAMGDSPIHYMGHIRMMAAAQPFISGAISKTVNMPESVTVDEVEQAYVEGWKLGLKALAIYRDNCKVGQPLSADKKVTTDSGAVIELDQAPVRRRLPKSRPSKTTSFRVGDIEGYLTAGSYPDDGLGEIFVKVSKQGSTLSGVMDAFAIAVSVGLQYGVPLEALVAKFVNMIFEPNGMTDDPDIRIAQSLVDYLARRLAIDYLDVETRQALGVKTTAERIAELNGTEPPAPAAAAEATPPAGAEPAEAPAAEVPAAPAAPAAPRAASGLAFTPGTAAVDAPYCSTCGVRMRPAGSCFVCESCGTTSGCS